MIKFQTREIKFRTWDTYLKEFSECVNPFFDTCEGRFILLQYTGIKDKTWKEIYEGDILFLKFKTYEITGYVRYNKPCFEIVSESSCYNFYNYEEATIVGNIFENSKILKVDLCQT